MLVPIKYLIPFPAGKFDKLRKPVHKEISKSQQKFKNTKLHFWYILCFLLSGGLEFVPLFSYNSGRL